MTDSISDALDRRRRRAKPETELYTMAGDLVTALQLIVEHNTGIKLPSSRYQKEPVAFFREILGLEPWSKQREVLEAIRDFDRVAVKSGHKCGKSSVAAGVALWFYSSFTDARAVMTSTTARQVDQILWRELRMMRARAGRCVDCKREDPDGLRIPRPCPHSALIDGELGDLARTGLKAVDFREIVGFTAKESEAVAGISGSNVLYIADEASGIDDMIFEAIEGNSAGGSKRLLLGNPTKNEGEFYETEYSKSAFYKVIHISSEESPNVVAGKRLIPGLAEREWVEEKKREWGETSALYLVRVKGQHPINEAGKIFSVKVIGSSEQRWAETEGAGRLYVGCDPAGEAGSGDEVAFSTRRGLKQLELGRHAGLDDRGHLAELLSIIHRHKLPREIPVVVLDADGQVGAKVLRVLRDYIDSPEGRNRFELVVVRAGANAFREPMVYTQVRDELAANLEAWMRDGGAIVEDAKLARELHALEWLQNVKGKIKLTPKRELRKILGRSPDSYDATALSVWEPLALQDDKDELPASVKAVARAGRTIVRDDEDDDDAIDPYQGAEVFQRPPRR